MPKYKGERPDELFVGNTEVDPLTPALPNYLGTLKTARLGEVALDIDGRPLPANYRPIFVHRSERDRHDQIMMVRTFGPAYRVIPTLTR